MFNEAGRDESNCANFFFEFCWIRNATHFATKVTFYEQTDFFYNQFLGIRNVESFFSIKGALQLKNYFEFDFFIEFGDFDKKQTIGTLIWWFETSLVYRIHFWEFGLQKNDCLKIGTRNFLKLSFEFEIRYLENVP